MRSTSRCSLGSQPFNNVPFGSAWQPYSQDPTQTAQFNGNTNLPVADTGHCQICGRDGVPTLRIYDPDPRVLQVICADQHDCAAQFDTPDGAASRRPRPKRRDTVENDEYAAFVRRIIRAFSRRTNLIFGRFICGR